MRIGLEDSSPARPARSDAYLVIVPEQHVREQVAVVVAQMLSQGSTEARVSSYEPFDKVGGVRGGTASQRVRRC